MHVGIFGGTFDPPHLGHLIIAQEAHAQAGLDSVVFVPAMAPPHKRGFAVSPFSVRLAMVQAAIEDNSAFEVSDIEGRLPVPSFTVDTLRALRRLRPEWDDIDLIMGSDSMLELPTWRTPGELVAMARLVVYPRQGAPVPEARPEFSSAALVLDVPELPFSSTAIRGRVSQGRSLKYWVPEGVMPLIARHGLYRPEREN
ncbi:nicotinate (nicotinamide) nucleotide adenylyltransferase [Candidatus Fermentibacteria bacterium]|nr:nicotinate (nicotinamide) nucleotide adenylyltransferase [Candidatus Fermentibacteria bacterium]